LKGACLSEHILARMRGDEFAVFVPDVESVGDVEVLASTIVAAIKSTIVIRGLSLKVGASAGFSVSPLDSECGVELLKNADIAMYYNKANKLNSVCRFNKKMAGEHQQRLQLELDLKRALDNNEFTLVYQPKVCTFSGQVNGVEALLRWSHPERGLISPAQFIPVAEDIGLMGSIGQWVLNEACREVAQLQSQSLPQLKVAVNISAQQFCDDQFFELMHTALSTHGLNHDSLELEVTESLIMMDIGRVISLLQRLKDSGITIAIDDFGTGYSSLQYLQQLPLNTLKIDRAFITALDACDPTNSVANSIVQLAKLFNLETVAEGVETDEQDLKIRSLGVHFIQGYFYSKPVPACDLLAAVQRISQQLDVQSSYYQQRSA
jgi:EAL domain-containing protein (putative c-di-GMP-specific phosphodiesterase class I)